MIVRGFDVCGITSTDPSKVRNDMFYQNIMKKVLEEMKDYSEELIDDDPFAVDQNNESILEI